MLVTGSPPQSNASCQPELPVRFKIASAICMVCLAVFVATLGEYLGTCLVVCSVVATAVFSGFLALYISLSALNQQRVDLKQSLNYAVPHFDTPGDKRYFCANLLNSQLALDRLIVESVIMRMGYDELWETLGALLYDGYDHKLALLIAEVICSRHPPNDIAPADIRQLIVDCWKGGYGEVRQGEQIPYLEKECEEPTSPLELKLALLLSQGKRAQCGFYWWGKDTLPVFRAILLAKTDKWASPLTSQ